MRQFRHAAVAVFLQLLFPFFAVAAAPVISSLTPNTGAVGSSIVIAGSNFGTSATNASVTFNGTTATISTISSTSITAKVPTGATTGNVVVKVSGVASNGVLFTVTSPPSISSLTPNTGAVGSSIVIAGSNFGPTQGTGSVVFNGKTATITSWSASQIVATVPTQATTGNVVVTAAGGVASTGVSFTVTAAPSITSLVPTSGIVGAAVTINGSGFGPTQGNGKVTFNGTTATINSWSATQITTSVPAGATTGSVIVTAAGGVASKGVTFTVIPPPSITSISPTSGVTGTAVTISGSNFGSTQGSSTVTFNGTAGTVTSWSSTKVIATVPTAATTGNVVVTVNTQASNGVNFKVLPHITSESPTTQPIGKNVTINGSGFGSSQGSSTVTVGGVAASAATWTTTQIIATVPSGAAVGSDPIVVTVGGSASNSAAFTAVAALAVTASAAPTPNANGWNNTNVTISYTCSGGVTPVQCPATKTVSTEGLNQTITATATDANGNTTSVSTSVSIDKTAPTITATVTPAANAKGVVTAPATVTFTCSDSLSGIASCPSPVQVTTAGLNESFSGSATDKAGNTANATLTVSVQTAPLAITASAAPPANAAGWNNSSVTISYTCSGGVAPLQCAGPQTFSTEGANQIASASVTDAAGQSASTSATVNIDETPPTISASVSPTPNGNGIIFGPSATVTFTCSDSLSGVATCPPSPQTITTQGLQTISGTAFDKAGNTASASVQFNLQNFPPLQIVPVVSPAPNAAGWNNTPVTVSFQCTGGVPPVSCPGSQSLNSEGANQTVSGTATDGQGNSASASVTVNIDLTPPVISASLSALPGDNGIILDTSATVTFTCSDALSGVATCPSTVTITTAGPENISGTAVDIAGNTATASVQFDLEPFLPLTVTTTLQPPPNAAGWNSTAVTVTFVCAGGAQPVTCPDAQTVSTDGANQVVTATATDANGNTAVGTATVNVDQTPPLLSITAPTDGSITTSAGVPVSGLVSDDLSGVTSVTCNGTPASFSNGSFNCSLTITQGTLGISVIATDVAGNTTTSSITTNLQGPNLTITSPNPLDLFNTKTITVTGTIDDPNATIAVNGVQTDNNNGTFTAQNVVLREGSNVVTATGTNAGGAAGTASVNVVLDTTPPIVTIDSPSDGAVLTTPQVYVTGMVNDVVPGTVNLAQATVVVNGVSADVTHRSFMAEDVLLVPGKNVITAIATDRAGNTSQNSITVTLLDASAQQRILMVSGNGQAAPVASSLPQPLTVEVVNAAGQAMPNVPITFNLVKGDGQLTAFPQQGRQITTQTDGNGQASATLLLGTRVGSGNNQVLVSSPGFVGQVMFCATATVGPAAQIHDIAGEAQKGVIGQPLPQPFTVVVFDGGGNPAAGAPVVFNVEQGGGTIEGQTTVTKTTDSDGRASAVLTLAQEEGINNNVVSASVAGITGPPAAFSASGVTPGNVTNTTVSGTVLDNANAPLVNVTASIEGTNLTALTDQNGHFVIQNAPVGSLNLFIDGSTSTESEPYPFLEFPIVTVSGQDNHLPSPIFLPELDLDNSAIVGGDEDVTLTMKGVPGVQFTVFAHSATFPDGTHVGRLSVSQVHSDKVPMPPPNATAPHLFWTVQPPRVKFNPPMQIKIPNTEGIPPGTVTEIFCYNHDLEEFASGGTARVSEDGASIISDPGSGVIVSGWGDAPPPPPPPSCADGCGKCGTCENGACVMDPPLDTSVTEVSRTFGIDSEIVNKINDDLRPLLGLGIAAKVDVAQITGKVATRQCCGPETGVGNNTKGSVSGLLAGITIQGKIWPPGPIPNVDITVTLFGFGSVEAKAQFLGGIFVNLAAKINGEVGYQQNDCSEKPVNRSGCIFAKAAVPVTAGFSAQIGGSASISWDCIFCTKTTIEGEATLLLGGVSFTINIADISYNQPDCDSGIQGGTFDAEPGKAEISVEIKGNYVQNGVQSGFDIVHKFLACTIDFTKSPIFDCHSDI